MWSGADVTSRRAAALHPFRAARARPHAAHGPQGVVYLLARGSGVSGGSRWTALGPPDLVLVDRNGRDGRMPELLCSFFFFLSFLFLLLI